MRFAVTTIGCKVNQYESQAVAALLEGLGWSRLPPAETAQDGPADLVVVNTCCVTSRAAAKSRQAVRRALRRCSNGRVLVLGCYATVGDEALARLAAQAGAGAFALAGHRDDAAARVRAWATALSDQALPGRAMQDQDAGPQPPGPSPQASAESTWGTSGSSAAPPRPGIVGNDECMKDQAIFIPAPRGPRPPLSDPDGRGGDRPTTPVILARPPAIVKPEETGSAGRAGTSGLPGIRAFPGRQRAFVKVQDGCDAFCSYCIVPYARPALWSRGVEDILAEVRGLVAGGRREIVLCGVHLGAYGRQSARPGPAREGPAGRPPAAGPPLPDLLRRVAAVEGLWRVRLSSLEVLDVTEELLDALASCPAAAPHLHLPLQSGSDGVLRRMNRPYDGEEYLRTVARVRQRLDRPAITADVLVGFPGESEADFAATLQVARRAGFSKIHVFPFSPRRGTAAWAWRDEAPPPGIVRRRCGRLAELERQSADAFRRQFLGQTVEVLVEQPGARTPAGCARGLTDRYVRVTFPVAAPGGPGRFVGKVVPVRITDLTPAGLAGSL